MDSRITSVGPRASKDMESTILPDPEFYDVGRSVSGWYNFGGIPSIRRFVSTRFHSAGQKVNRLPTTSRDPRRLSHATDSTYSQNKGVGFVMVSSHDMSHHSTPSDGEGERIHRRKLFFILGGMLLIAAAVAGVAIAMTNKQTSGQLEPSVPGDGTRQPTFSPTVAPTLLNATAAPTATTLPDEPFTTLSHQVASSYDIERRCFLLYCEEKLTFTQRLQVRNQLQDDVEVVKLGGTLKYKDESWATVSLKKTIALKKLEDTYVELSMITVFLTAEEKDVMINSLKNCTTAAATPWSLNLTMDYSNKAKETNQFAFQVGYPCVTYDPKA